MAAAGGLGVFARELQEEDLIDCLSIKPARIGDELVGHAHAIEIWKSLIRHQASTSCVIEAPGFAVGCRIVAFGADVSVSQEFADAELSNPRPGLNSRIIASIAERRSVVLSEGDVRAGNTDGGLDLVILYGSWRSVLGPEGVTEVHAALAARFLEQRQGYRIKRIITETVDEDERCHRLATHVYQEIRRFSEGRSLMVVTRGAALSVKLSLASKLFHYREPVLQLRDSDQKLLLAALSGLTDEELCHKLDLTLAAIKKRWISVFERTIHSRPDLFPEADDRTNGAKRGSQKRHHVLAYMRAHPEELRPIEWRSRIGATRI